jgi:hypothetical protein
MIFKPKKHNVIWQIFLIFAVLFFCLLIIERYELYNNFSVLPGDAYDAVIMTTILEHWFHVFCGIEKWSYVNYFFPYTNTIAQTDGYFLIGVPYSLFRFLGFDPFLASDLTGLVIKAFGFLGMFLLTRKYFSFTFYWALFIAVLFTLSNGITIHSSRLQLATVAFAPALFMLIWGAVKALWQNDLPQFRKKGALSGLFFGAWCLTCFYMAWFFLFFLVTFFILLLFLGGKQKIIEVKDKILNNYWSIIFVIVLSLFFLLPFISVYLPKSLEVGVRHYGSVRHYTVSLAGILQVGTENFMWGNIYNSILATIHYVPSGGEYYNTGVPFILFFVFLCSCIYIIKTKENLVDLALVFATLITWIFIINIAHHSAWFFIYHLFPGAKALNVISAYQFFLVFPVIIIAVRYLSTQHIVTPILFLLCALMIVEEINHPYLSLDRKVELNKLLLPNGLPPKICKVFYVSGWAEQTSNGDGVMSIYPHNVTAMMIAERIHIPTINGVASFSPPDWNFSNPNNVDYDARILTYAKKHGITDLCKLDLNNKRWSIVTIN